MNESGWRQPAKPLKPIGCLHFAALVAVFTVHRHDFGHEFVCTCGEVFVVARATNGDKTLVPKKVRP